MNNEPSPSSCTRILNSLQSNFTKIHENIHVSNAMVEQLRDWFAIDDVTKVDLLASSKHIRWPLLYYHMRNASLGNYEFDGFVNALIGTNQHELAKLVDLDLYEKYVV